MSQLRPHQHPRLGDKARPRQRVGVHLLRELPLGPCDRHRRRHVHREIGLATGLALLQRQPVHGEHLALVALGQLVVHGVGGGGDGVLREPLRGRRRPTGRPDEHVGEGAGDAGRAVPAVDDLDRLLAVDGCAVPRCALVLAPGLARPRVEVVEARVLRSGEREAVVRVMLAVGLGGRAGHLGALERRARPRPGAGQQTGHGLVARGLLHRQQRDRPGVHVVGPARVLAAGVRGPTRPHALGACSRSSPPDVDRVKILTAAPRLPASWPAYPQEIPRRPTAHCRPRRWRASGRGRSGSTCTCRSARRAAATAISTRTCPASGAPSRPAATSAPCSPRSTSRRRCSRPRSPRVDTVFFGGGTPTLLSAGDLTGSCAGSTSASACEPGAEVTTEANPESVDPAQARGAARGRLHAPLAGDAERRAAGAGDPRARALPRPPAAGRRRGARRRLRAGQPRPDLRHPGRDRGRLARLARRRAERRARPPLDLLADRRARHADGRAGAPRRARGAGRGGDRRPLRDRRARARRGRDGVVRDLLVGDRRGRLVPAQPRLLGRRRLVGRRAGRAQPRRRGALVERAAPAGVERAARGRPRHRRRRASCPARTRFAWSA